MKIFFSLMMLFFTTFSFAQNFQAVSQVLVPRDIFVADQGVLHYSFKSETDFFNFYSSEKISGDTLILPLNEKNLLENENDCTIKKAELIRTNEGYTIKITIVPWKPGQIHFKEFDLAKGDKKNSDVGIPFFIKLAPVNVLSLSQKLGDFSLRPPKSPLLLPGTTYFLWGVALCAIFFLSLLIFVLIHLKKISQRIRQKIKKCTLRNNAKIAIKSLRILLKKQTSDSYFAQEFQKIIKKYLKVRFSYNFDSVTSSKISSVIFKVTDSSLPEVAQESLFDLCSIFTRADYIRFAKGSLDSLRIPNEKYATTFSSGEREFFFERAKKIIFTFENEDKND